MIPNYLLLIYLQQLDCIIIKYIYIYIYIYIYWGGGGVNNSLNPEQTDSSNCNMNYKIILDILRIYIGYINIIIIHYIYIVLFWVLKALYIEGGNLNYHQCAASNWMMQRQPYCARTPTTHQLIGGEETIGVWGLLGGHDGQRPIGKFGQDAGVTPLLLLDF